MRLLKQLFRQIIRPIAYTFYYLPFKNKLNRSRSGQPLKPGITAVVAMKDEEYTLPFCLKSLVGFADQVVIVDNGSEDQSLAEAKTFKNTYGDRIEVDIIELPGALLGDCREAGLDATRYQWHLRWDADMIAHTSGENDIKRLREKVLLDNRPRTIRLPRVNIQGDFKHILGKVTDSGEPILVWFTKGVFYEEKGKFDLLNVPLYFVKKPEERYYYLHCAGLKSDENRMHRFHYFTWREWYNQTPKKELPDFMLDLNAFKQKRNRYLFDTSDPLSVKYRFGKQYVSLLSKFNAEEYGGYPEVLKSELQNNPRFEVVYDEKNKKPVQRLDKKDQAMMTYKPTQEDLEWSVESFFEKIKDESFLDYS